MIIAHLLSAAAFIALISKQEKKLSRRERRALEDQMNDLIFKIESGVYQ